MSDMDYQKELLDTRIKIARILKLKFEPIEEEKKECCSICGHYHSDHICPEKKESELRELRRKDHDCDLPCYKCPRKEICDKQDNEIISLACRKVDEPIEEICQICKGKMVHKLDVKQKLEGM